MKVKIKTFNGELPDYFTLGKEYNAMVRSDYSLFIIDDDSDSILCAFNGYPHLNGGSWEIVE